MSPWPWKPQDEVPRPPGLLDCSPLPRGQHSPCHRTPQAQHSRNTNRHKGKLCSSHRLAGEPQTCQCVLSHGTGALVPRGRACRGHTHTHTPPAQRGLLTASAGLRAPGLPVWDRAGQDQTPKGQHGEARQHCRSGAWTLPWRQGWPWDRQHGGCRAGRGLGP